MQANRRNPAQSLLTPAIKYVCALGGERRPIEAFSMNQRNKAGIGRRYVDPTACGMICMDHANASNQKLQCQNCNKTLPRDQFSRSTRRNHEFICMKCREWLDNEPAPGAGADAWSDDEEHEYRVVFPPSRDDSQSIDHSDPIASTLDVSTSKVDDSTHETSSESAYEGYIPKHLLDEEKPETYSAHIIDVSDTATINAERTDVSEAGEELSSIAPNPWYRGQGKATQLEGGLRDLSMAESYSPGGLEKASSYQPSDRFIRAWDDDGRCLIIGTVDGDHHIQTTKQNDANHDDNANRDLLRPKRPDYRSEQDWLRAQPNTIFDDPDNSYHEN